MTLFLVEAPDAMDTHDSMAHLTAARLFPTQAGTQPLDGTR
jgi:hypothetical protein